MGKRGRHGEHSHAGHDAGHVQGMFRGTWEYQARHRADVEDLGEQRRVRSAVRQRRPRHRAPVDVKVALGRILRDEENLKPLAAVTKRIVSGGEERRRRAACWTPRSGKVKPDHLMGSNQRSSEAVRGNPRSSEVISGQREARSPSAREVISGHQRSSAVISGHHLHPLERFFDRDRGELTTGRDVRARRRLREGGDAPLALLCRDLAARLERVCLAHLWGEGAVVSTCMQGISSSAYASRTAAAALPTG